MIVNLLEEQIPVVLRLVWNLLLVASGKSDFAFRNHGLGKWSASSCDFGI